MADTVAICRRCDTERSIDCFQTLPHGRRRVCRFCRGLKTGLPRVRRETRPVQHPTLIDIAWAAGVYEGEGHVRLNNNGRGGHGVQLTVTQKDPWILQRLRDWFGGAIYVNRRPYMGQAYVMHHWHVYGPRARAFILTVFTWLSPRRRVQVRACLGV